MDCQQEVRFQRTLEALEDVDAGRVVSHEAVQSWAEGLSSGPMQKLATILGVTEMGDLSALQCLEAKISTK